MPRIVVSAALLLTAALLAGCGNPDAPPPQALLVKTEIVKLRTRQASVALTGDVQARFKADLAFRVSGRVVERMVDVGAHVNAGDVLAKIDPTEQLADIESAKATVAAAESQLRVATSNFERQQGLLAKGFTTRPSFDQAQQALRTAEGSLDGAKAQLATANDALSYTNLRASAPGLITARTIEVGQIAQAAQTAFTLAQDGARDAVIDVYESIFFQQYDSDVVQLNLVSNPEVKATGHVREISPTIDPKTSTVRVKLTIDNPPAAMTLGSIVTGTGQWKPVQRVILPWSALTAGSNGPAVWIVDPASRAVSLKPVVIDSYETGTVIIKDGLAPGERVVTEGNKMLSVGQIVTFERDDK
ncbi:MAG: Secretion protein HlyD [Tardiphaga sp.]|nr:Secretion protein HlyD [Tardiphaga sp.]MDB5547504.1 Secretion protein HlyD [Tardiphaga sp.]